MNKLLIATICLTAFAIPALAEDVEIKAKKDISLVLKELAPLLAQNKFADATALLDSKLKDPALADVSDLLKQEKADVEAVVELRKQAVDAIRKMTGKMVTLKKGAGAITGKVTDDASGKGVTLDIGGPVMTVSPERIHVDDIDANAPKLADAVENLRRRGIMFFYSGNIQKAKDYFTKAADAGGTSTVQPYLDRIATIAMGEIEVAAQKGWENAEKLFAAKNMKAGKDAYEAFEKQYGQTQTAAKQATLLKERYAAIESMLGPPPTLTLALGGGVKMELVLIPAGTFKMGSPDNEADRQGQQESPQHEVAITKPFYMGKYEVTVGQFRRFAEIAKYQTDAERAGNIGWSYDNGWKEHSGVNWKMPNFPQEDDHPVCLVSWNDAKAFVLWAAKATGTAVRLPSEAEWEYACRAKTTTRFYIGDQDKDLDKAGWFDGNSGRKTHPVGQKTPNAWGLFDIHGNVWQWCEDRGQMDYYANSPRTDPPGPLDFGNDRVLRGGGFDDPPANCRSAKRSWRNHALRDTSIGFRVVVAGVPSRTP